MYESSYIKRALGTPAPLSVATMGTKGLAARTPTTR